MRVSQEDLRAMYGRLEKNRAKVKPQFAGQRPYEKSKEGLPLIPSGSSSQTKITTNKYRNVKVEYDGMKFDSKHELKCWLGLKLYEKAGEISRLERQVRFDLEVNGKRTGKITVDFTWFEKSTGDYVVADAKSEITRKETAYRLRKKIFEAQYAPLVIREL